MAGWEGWGGVHPIENQGSFPRADGDTLIRRSFHRRHSGGGAKWDIKGYDDGAGWVRPWLMPFSLSLPATQFIWT